MTQSCFISYIHSVYILSIDQRREDFDTKKELQTPPTGHEQANLCANKSSTIIERLTDSAGTELVMPIGGICSVHMFTKVTTQLLVPCPNERQLVLPQYFFCFQQMMIQTPSDAEKDFFAMHFHLLVAIQKKLCE